MVSVSSRRRWSSVGGSLREKVVVGLRGRGHVLNVAMTSSRREGTEKGEYAQYHIEPALAEKGPGTCHYTTSVACHAKHERRYARQHGNIKRE